MPPILVPSSAKRIATQILVILKLNEREDFILRGFVSYIIRPYKEQSQQPTDAQEQGVKIHYRTLQVVYSEYHKPYEELLQTDKYISIHQTITYFGFRGL